HRVAVHRADERLGKGAEDLEGAVPALGQALDEVRGRRHRVGLRILQVGAGGEGAAGLIAREDGAAGLVVVLPRGEVPGDPLVEVRTPGIARLRAAQGDDPDVAALLIGDGHGVVLGLLELQPKHGAQPIFTPYFSRVSSRSSRPSPGASGTAMKPSTMAGRSRKSSNQRGSRVGS